MLSYTGLTDLSAPKGTAGTLLLDPQNVTICQDCVDNDEDNDDGPPTTSVGGVITPTDNDSKLAATDLKIS